MGRVHLDVGSGDGCGPYRWARRTPEWLFVATDLNPDVLLSSAVRAARKASRGGVPNLLCIAEPVEVLANELAGFANRVSILLPWGQLLGYVARPEPSFLAYLRRVCAPGAIVEVVFAYDERRDAGQLERLRLAGIEEAHVRGVLAESYERAGFCVNSADRISQTELQSYETTWARRLTFSRPREIWRLHLAARDET